MMSRLAPDPVYTLRGSTSPLSYLKFKDTETLYSGNYDGEVHVWSMETRRVFTTISAHPGKSVLYVDFTDDSHMLTHGRDGSVKTWSKSSAAWIQNGAVECCDKGFCGSCLLADGMLATPSNNQSQVVLLHIDTLKVISHLKPDISTEQLGMCMKIKRADDKRLLIGYEDGSVASWDIRQNKMVDRLKVHTDAVMCMDYSSVLNKGFSGSVSEHLNTWVSSGDKLNMGTSVTTTNPGFNDALVRNDGKLVIFAGWDGNIRIFGAKKLKPLAVLNVHSESVHCLAFNEDNILACGSKDKLISLWDIYR